VALSIGAAYVARSFNNIMDVLQLVLTATLILNVVFW
jgi:hypothetical protein